MFFQMWLISLCALLVCALSVVAAPVSLEERSITKSGDGASIAISLSFPDVDGCIAATFYKPGLGACGKTNHDNDLIVAASHSVFDTFP